MTKKWSVFGEYNIYTGCDDLLGHVEVDEKEDGFVENYVEGMNALKEARLKFPHNTISHVNGPHMIIQSNEEENALFEYHQRERRGGTRQESVSKNEKTPAISSAPRHGKQKSVGGMAVVVMIVLVLLVALAMYLPPIQ